MDAMVLKNLAPNGSEWVWTDLKNRAKKKASEIETYRLTTGGGPKGSTKLTDFEERIVAFLSAESVYGLDGPDGTPLESDAPILPDPSPTPNSSASWVVEYLEEDIEELQSTCTANIPNITSDTTPTFTPETTTISTLETTTIFTPEPAVKKTKKRISAKSAAEQMVEMGKTKLDMLKTVCDRLGDLVEVNKRMVEENTVTNNLLKQLIDTIKKNIYIY